MGRRQGAAVATVAWMMLALLGGGCAAGVYLDARRNVAPGGQQERDIAAANTQLTAAQAQNAQLQQARTQRERDLDDNDRRIRALEADLHRQDATLAAALKARQVTQGRHDQIRRDLDALRADMQAVQMQNRGDRLAKTSEPGADAAKEARLRDLEKRKKELEGALSALARR